MQGYLAMSLLIDEHSELMQLAKAVIMRDLADMKEAYTCLGLHALANLSHTPLGAALADDVLKLLVSPTSPPSVQKKAALTMLRIYRHAPSAINVTEWCDRIALLMENRHLGVAQCAAALAMELARHAPEPHVPCYHAAVFQLYEVVVQENYRDIYLYHHVPAPWLQVQLLALLQCFPPTQDAHLRSQIHAVLETILRVAAPVPVSDGQQSNAHNAVLFEAMRLAMHLDPASPIVSRSAVLLGRFVTSPETNVRYLGLEVMAQLAYALADLAPIQMHQDAVLHALYDRDISVRRRALDVAYAMCDEDYAPTIITHLLRLLPRADVVLREEMALKISVLAEMYTQDFRWYIQAMLALINVAGDQVDDKVWFRAVQVITNHPEVQAYAVGAVFFFMSQPVCHETLIKMGAYLLGEFGYLISERPGATPAKQFEVLQSHARYCSTAAQAMLLSTYAKWVSLYPVIRPQLLAELQRYSSALDSELQQRACEYLALAAFGEPLARVMEELPPFTAAAMSNAGRELRRPRPSKRARMPQVYSVPRGEASRTRLSMLPPLQLQPMSSASDVSAVSPTRGPLYVTANTNTPCEDDNSDLLDLRSMHSLRISDTDTVGASLDMSPKLKSSEECPLLDSDAGDVRSVRSATPHALNLRASPEAADEPACKARAAAVAPHADEPKTAASGHGPVPTEPAVDADISPPTCAARSVPKFSLPKPSVKSLMPAAAARRGGAPTVTVTELSHVSLATSIEASPGKRPYAVGAVADAPWNTLHLPDGPSHQTTQSPRSHSLSNGPTPSDSSVAQSSLEAAAPPVRPLASLGTLLRSDICEITHERGACHGAQVTLVLRVHNRQADVLQLTGMAVRSAAVHAHIAEQPSTALISPGASAERTVVLASVDVVDTPVVASIVLVPAGCAPVDFELTLPVTAAQFCVPHTLDVGAFFDEWRQMAPSAGLEAQLVLSIRPHGNDTARYSATLAAAGFAVLPGIDVRSETLVAAAALCTEHSRMLVLVRFEPSAAACLARLTVRAANGTAAQALLALLAKPLAE